MDDARRELVRDAQHGGISLILGAGVASACRVATWQELAQRLWQHAFHAPLPAPADDPRFYPFVFERVQRALQGDFEQRLRQTLYAGHQLPSRDELLTSTTNTLAVVARIIAREARSRRRRLVRVITLNVDDLLERAVDSLAGADPRDPAVVPIVRGVSHASFSHGAGPLPVYHLHGYLRSERATGTPPRDLPSAGDAADVLVFTDLQYWASAAVPSSHMNRTFSFALHDSHCIFVGTSMADLNIWRWLALRAFEIAADLKSQCAAEADGGARELEAAYRRSLDRHYWITSTEEEHKAFLSECLALRGVRTVDISGWDDDSLSEVLEECFGEGG